MPWSFDGHFMGMHWLWWSLWIVIFLTLVWGMARLLGDRPRPLDGAGREEPAEEALRRRFANGEIDEEEFERRLKVLRGSGASR